MYKLPIPISTERKAWKKILKSIGCVNVGDLALLWFPDNFGQTP